MRHASGEAEQLFSPYDDLESRTRRVVQIATEQSVLPAAPTAQRCGQLLRQLDARFASSSAAAADETSSSAQAQQASLLTASDTEQNHNTSSTSAAAALATNTIGSHAGTEESAPRISRCLFGLHEQAVNARERSFLAAQGFPTEARVASAFAAAGSHSELGAFLQFFADGLVQLFTRGVQSNLDFATQLELRLQAGMSERDGPLTPYAFELQGLSTLYSYIWSQLALAECYVRHGHTERGPSAADSAATTRTTTIVTTTTNESHTAAARPSTTASTAIAAADATNTTTTTTAHASSMAPTASVTTRPNAVPELVVADLVTAQHHDHSRTSLASPHFEDRVTSITDAPITMSNATLTAVIGGNETGATNHKAGKSRVSEERSMVKLLPVVPSQQPHLSAKPKTSQLASSMTNSTMMMMMQSSLSSRTRPVPLHVAQLSLPSSPHTHRKNVSGGAANNNNNENSSSESVSSYESDDSIAMDDDDDDDDYSDSDDDDEEYEYDGEVNGQRYRHRGAAYRDGHRGRRRALHKRRHRSKPPFNRSMNNVSLLSSAQQQQQQQLSGSSPAPAPTLGRQTRSFASHSHALSAHARQVALHNSAQPMQLPVSGIGPGLNSSPPSIFLPPARSQPLVMLLPNNNNNNNNNNNKQMYEGGNAQVSPASASLHGMPAGGPPRVQGNLSFHDLQHKVEALMQEERTEALRQQLGVSQIRNFAEERDAADYMRQLHEYTLSDNDLL